MNTEIEAVQQPTAGVAHQFLCCPSSFFTLKDQPGASYDTLTIADLEERMRAPTAVSKRDAAFFIPSSYVGHDGRSHEAQRACGSFGALTLDVDQGNISLAALEAALDAVLGPVQVLVYSSSGATPENRKWRTIVPLAAPIPGREFAAYQTAFYDALEAHGIIADRTLARTGQPIFAPNVPPERRDADGAPFFYHSLALDGDLFDVRAGELHEAAQEILAEDADRAEIAAAAEGEALPDFVRWARDTFPLEDKLEQHGYQRRMSLYGRPMNDWQSPFSSGYSTRCFGEHWVSLSYSDAVRGIGRAKGTTGEDDGAAQPKHRYRFGDVVDVITFFEFGNDAEAARAWIEQEMRRTYDETRMRLVPHLERMAAAAGVEISEGYCYSQPRFDWDEWFFLRNQNLFANAITGEVLTVSAFDQAFAMRVPMVEVGDTGKFVRHKPSRHFALNEMPTVYDRMYAPDMPHVFEHQLKEWLNSYNLASVPTAIPGDGWQLCEDHLRRLLPNDWRTVLQWMGYIVQNPGKKIRWALVIKGAEGDGKTTLARIVQAAIGAANVRVVSNDVVRSSFNGYAEGAQLVVLEEIRAKGESRFDVMNRLKPVLTNDTIDVVEKNARAKNVANVTSYLLLTNWEDALPIDDNDRRHFVCFTRCDDAADVAEHFPPEHFVALYDVIDNDAGAIRHWLLNVDLTGFNPHKLPAGGNGRTKMIALGASGDVAAIRSLIELGAHREINEDFVLTSKLGRVLSDMGEPLKTSALARALTDLRYEQTEGPVKIKGKTERVYVRKKNDLWRMSPEERNKVIRARVEGDTPTSGAVAALAKLRP